MGGAGATSPETGEKPAWEQPGGHRDTRTLWAWVRRASGVLRPTDARGLRTGSPFKAIVFYSVKGAGRRRRSRRRWGGTGVLLFILIFGGHRFQGEPRGRSWALPWSRGTQGGHVCRHGRVSVVPRQLPASILPLVCHIRFNWARNFLTFPKATSSLL